MDIILWPSLRILQHNDQTDLKLFPFQETTETPLQSPPTRDVEEPPSSTSSAKSGTTSEEAPPSNEGLHCLGLEDLARALGEAKLQKCVSVRKKYKGA